VKRLRDKDGGDLAILARKIARVVNDNGHALRHVEPKAPDALNDRQADAWDPLFAIADVAGGDWPARAARTALALCHVEEAEAVERDIKLMLRSDVRDTFSRLFPEEGTAHKAERAGRPDDCPRLLTKRLLDELHGLEERPWNAWGKLKKPMTDTDFASLLRPYRIRSSTVRGEDAIGNPERGKGYYLRSFRDVFSRYLPHFGPSGRDNVTSLENAWEIGISEDVTSSICHRSENPGNANKSGACHDVTAQNGGNGSAAGFDGARDDDVAVRDGLL
jgi:hypothetical protein